MDDKTMVPLAALEIVSTRHDRTMKRMCIAFVIAFCVLAICTTIMCCVLAKHVNVYHSAEAVTETYAETIP